MHVLVGSQKTHVIENKALQENINKEKNNINENKTNTNGKIY